KGTDMSYILQEARLGQQTTLSPRLQQSVKLLQMSALEFSATLEQAIANNPFLEQIDNPGQEDGDDGSQIAAGAETKADGESMASQVLLSDDHSQPSTRESSSGSRGVNEQINYAEIRATLAPTLAQRLLGMLGMYRASARHKLLAAFIIDALEEDGYLRTAF